MFISKRIHILLLSMYILCVATAQTDVGLFLFSADFVFHVCCFMCFNKNFTYLFWRNQQTNFFSRNITFHGSELSSQHSYTIFKLVEVESSSWANKKIALHTCTRSKKFFNLRLIQSITFSPRVSVAPGVFSVVYLDDFFLWKIIKTEIERMPNLHSSKSISNEYREDVHCSHLKCPSTWPKRVKRKKIQSDGKKKITKQEAKM